MDRPEEKNSETRILNTVMVAFHICRKRRQDVCLSTSENAKYSWPLNDIGVNCVGPLTHGNFLDKYSTIDVSSLPYDFFFFKFF